MNDSYSYRKVEYLKVLGNKASEPALPELFQATGIREERETNYDRDAFRETQKEEYLESISEELKCRGRALKHQLFEIGRLICDVRDILPHGEFKQWIENNFEQSYRTALNCLRVYRACMGTPEIVEYFKPSCLYIMCAPNFPRDLREALFENTKGPIEVSQKDMIEVAIRYKSGEIGIKDEQVQSILRKHRETNLWSKYKIELEALQTLVKGKLERIKGLSSKHQSYPLIQNNELSQEQQEQEDDFKYHIAQKVEQFKAELNIIIRELEDKM